MIVSLVDITKLKMFAFGCSWITILFACACAALATPPEKQIFDLDDEAQLVQLFNDFKQEYKKNYHPSERSDRYDIFVKNLAEINLMNNRDPSATYGITEFTDLTKEEFQDSYTGYIRDPSRIPGVVVNANEVPDIEIPKKFDWRDHNVVTSVKDQRNCGSCWAFAAVGALEGAYALKYKELMDFSPQQFVSCAHLFLSGCQGGDAGVAISDIEGYGLETEQDYPYISGRTGENETCKYEEKKAKLYIDKRLEYKFEHMTEDQIAQVLVSIGPLAIGVASHSVVNYSGGIISNENCKASIKEIDHAVLLVGYGEEEGTPYWLIKNSWGTAKGEKGYFRMQRGVNCLDFKEDIGVTATVANHFIAKIQIQ